MSQVEPPDNANHDDIQRVYGTFDASRVPELEIPTFESVKRIGAAVSPDCSYRLVRDAVRAAEETLDLYIYNVSAEHLLELLREARDRDVTLRIMYDAMDTRGDEKDKLQELGVELKTAPSTGRRKVFTVCHQKFLVVDGKTLVLGSANWAGTAIPKATVPGKFKKGNREWLVRIDDEAVAGWFAGLFQADWDIPELEGPQGLAPEPSAPEIPPMETRAAAVTVPAEIFDVHWPALGDGASVTPILSPDNYFELARSAIREAETSIDLQQQYILSGGTRTRALLKALSDRRDEVDIRILVSPAFAKNWERSLETLEEAGLADCVRGINLGSFTHLHNKGILVDRRRVIVSSTNLSENSITQAREAGVLIDSEAIGEYFGRVMDVDWSSGLDAADVPDALAAQIDAIERLDEVAQELHPADIRVI